MSSMLFDSNDDYETSIKFKSLLMSIFLSILYPSSLYVWRDTLRIDRNDPFIIKRNFFSFTIALLISSKLLTIFRQSTNTNNWNLFIECIFQPLIFITILFIGPICCDLNLNEILNDDIPRIDKQYFRQLLRSFDNQSILKIIRNLIVAPFTEEFLFRGILLAILSPFWSKFSCILISSILFSLMHSHSCLAKYVCGNSTTTTNFDDDFITTIIQCIYTGLFGIIASVQYLSSGHLITPFLLHFFCNLNGLPEFNRIFENRFYSILTTIDKSDNHNDNGDEQQQPTILTPCLIY
ncbi:CAAX prenyl protease [Dermatophagoides pteronyssinus]|uniref:CAAX prenyl protease 2 n=1 Tax=Dermatophagoides pteronyssinus TaxID=6956 RepID=A0ABQ8JTQ4_DERPT|nr:CAAX prenyl protease [Dermatophagoides pteronyssinus]